MTHGQTKTVLYKRWASMKRRCLNKNEFAYKWYGGRGIRVCKQWMRFEPFRDWAIANGFTENLTLDRIDSNKHYSPSNCRWVPFKEQTYNRRSNIKYRGELAMHASMRLGGNTSLVTDRIKIHGWTKHKAFTTPPRQHKAYKNSKQQI